ncbi:glycoside hydrolase family 28 protein [Trematosphaeria pertusa]|uniref:Glycoside hydrolase family 28 protein n=1 Tax=Trematosphaeria pertusa TaxID=390896 RepID=A0A6A6IAG1_9PLEO|nr:glycoside hydrolase family 28 protein [Trematosphaeria pertusa]KAF2246912.1 glycoside hydrolase family 28 protein [Trematosphaeria pertusa]
MRSFPILSLCFGIAIASSQVRKHEICTVESLNDPLADDVPAITAALKKCGQTGRILFPANQTFSIRSPFDLSPCQACDFQINGVLSISRDWDYWEKQAAVINIPRTTAAIIRTDGNTGVIDANRFGWAGDESLLERIPKLFSISDESYNIYIRNLKIRNVPGIVFYVNSNSSSVHLDDIDIADAATTGLLVEQAKHVYVWNNTIRATGSCVTILPNSTNVQFEESTCITTGTTTTTPSGIWLRFMAGSGLDWIHNVFVKNVKAIGGMKVISLAADPGENTAHPIEIKNVTFTGITIEGPAEEAVYVEEGQGPLYATEITFRDFEGDVQKESDLRCGSSASQCEFSREDWNITVQG